MLCLIVLGQEIAEREDACDLEYVLRILSISSNSNLIDVMADDNIADPKIKENGLIQVLLPHFKDNHYWFIFRNKWYRGTITQIKYSIQ